MKLTSVPIPRRRALSSIRRKSDIRRYVVKGLVMVPPKKRTVKISSAKKKSEKSKRKPKEKTSQGAMAGAEGSASAVAESGAAEVVNLEPAAKKAKTMRKKSATTKVGEELNEASTSAVEKMARFTAAVEVRKHVGEAEGVPVAGDVTEEVEEAPLRLEVKGKSSV